MEFWRGMIAHWHPIVGEDHSRETVLIRGIGDRSRLLQVLVLLALALQLQATSAWAVDFAGIAQNGAIDQPQVYMLLRTTPNGTPIVGQTADTDPSDPFGTVPTIGIQAYLDTGASGILISTATAQAWGLPNSTYNGQTVTFDDIGVAGTAAFNVSNPIYAGVAPFTPTSNTEDASTYVPVTSGGNPLPLRLEMGPADTGDNSLTGDLDFLEDIDVVGMSALSGKKVLIDARQSNQAVAAIAASGGDLNVLLNNVDNLSLHTYVYNAGDPSPVPGIGSTNLHVKLSYADFTAFTTTLPSGAPGPTLSHNPFIGPSPLAAPASATR
jgi:hypothetical protein